MPNNSNAFQPSESNERLNTSNITTVVKKEIDRLTKELVQETKELITSGIDYKSVEYIEEEAPEEYYANFIRDHFNDLISSIQVKLDQADAVETYLDYLDLFSVRYNNDSGKPEIILNIDLLDFNTDDIQVIGVFKE